MKPTLLACVLGLSATALAAQDIQFDVELRTGLGNPLTRLSQNDAGFTIRMLEPDLIEVISDSWTMRWAGSFMKWMVDFARSWIVVIKRSSISVVFISMMS